MNLEKAEIMIHEDIAYMLGASFDEWEAQHEDKFLLKAAYRDYVKGVSNHGENAYDYWKDCVTKYFENPAFFPRETMEFGFQGMEG